MRVGVDVDAVTAEHAARLAELDSLLPQPKPVDATADVLVGRAGDSVAIGVPKTVEVDANTLDACWGALRRHSLGVRISGAADDQPAALSALLDAWDERLRAVAEPGDADTSAGVLWPSRDTAAVPALVRHGFAPLVVTAALTASLTVSRLRGRFDGPPPAVHIRRATAGDLHTVARFQAEIIRYDSQFGEITHRPSTVDAAERDAAKQLAAEKPWIWLAERDGEPVGLLAVAPPADAEWIAGHTSAGPVGYLSSLYVTPKSRGRGVGRALADTGHRALREAGAEVVLLHHALPNPRSTPFWYATGYRPLWTAWYRRPVFRKTPAA